MVLGTRRELVAGVESIVTVGDDTYLSHRVIRQLPLRVTHGRHRSSNEQRLYSADNQGDRAVRFE